MRVLLKEGNTINDQQFPDDLKNVLVSLIIPAFNHERWIVDCLNSACEIEYDNLELLLIDDGSSDNTYKLASDWLSSHSKRFVRVVLGRQANQGVCRTINRLVSMSKGEYIRFIASDDMIAKSAVIDSLRCLKTSGKNFLFSDAAIIDEEGQDIAPSAFRYFHKSPSLLRKKMCLQMDVLLSWNLPLQLVFMRKDSLLSMGGLDESLPFEDLDLMLRLLALDDVAMCDKVTWYYRMDIENRLTPGVELNQMLSGKLRAYEKNVHGFYGLTKLIARLNIVSLGANRNKFVLVGFKILMRFLGLVHKVAMEMKIYFEKM